MVLLNPATYAGDGLAPEDAELVKRLIGFFEDKGKVALKHDDHERTWYQDFIEWQASERLFAKVLTPAAEGAGDTRWDTNRVNHVNEVLGFYGLAYWYTWQVSILGLGPIWMSPNDEARARAARFLEDGEVFAFGLSEQKRGADIYRSDMVLREDGDGFVANGEKYYIGNANAARMTSTFGRIGEGPLPDDASGKPNPDDYVFFAADSQHPSYEVVKNVVNSQNFVANYALHDYAVTPADILHRGEAAFEAALNTVNVGKYNLGWASIGICTHALYEAITHANNRNLYGSLVTDFPHVRQLFVDGYSRLVAMKLFASRASDYFRSASREDRRYLLFNPLVKMKVTTEGEKVIDHLWDVIAAKGFEKDTYFEMAARDIRALPKLEGTVHVNLALVLKFAANYLFNPAEYAPVPKRHDPSDDTFLWDQGPTRGLSRIQFADPGPVLASKDLPNVEVFRDQVEGLKRLLVEGMPDADQQRDLDIMMTLGQMFSLVPYAQLILEEAELRGDVDDALIDQVFDVFVRDMSGYAVELHGKRTSTPAQQKLALELVRKPVGDEARYTTVWEQVRALDGAYAMPA